MAKDPEVYAHQEWIGFVQPVGLVVSIPALLTEGILVNRNVAPIHQKFLSCLKKNELGEYLPIVEDFNVLFEHVLEWEPGDLLQLPERLEDTIYHSLAIAVPEYGEMLRPTYVVPEINPKFGQNPWLLLVQQSEGKNSFDEVHETDKQKWQATPHAKFERLLRESNVPIGLLINETQIRLIYAPRGETSGYITFDLSSMISVAGRPILGAFHMLLSNDSLFRLGDKQRLPALLAESRKYQNTVSNKLAEQVFAALYELLRGFQSANEQSNGRLLNKILKQAPDQVYSGLLTVLMRLVFILYAEDRNLLSSSSVYANFYSVSGLFERLRQDDGHYPDTMHHRFGAWSQLLSLFRIVFDGASHEQLSVPPRKGHLFDPNRFPFLEGRLDSDEFLSAEIIPHVSDGVIFKVLNYLLMLDGERLSYRTLDVEQIGSVYEAIMGFRLEIAEGPSIAIKPKKTNGAPVNVNIARLLSLKPLERAKWFREQTEQDISGVALESLKTASTVDDIVAALEKKIAYYATPSVVPTGNMILQPSNERRASGSHYTPRLLTEPIVRTTLHPVLAGLGVAPTPQQILDLKVCDPAMGSGAFLVEACRQLGDQLVKAWQRTNSLPQIPPDEDEILHARRLIAQRCVYGVDRNPMAVDLAKLSLWLATLAKDHPFTFLDHAFRCGDSLIGLTKEQIIRFHWQPEAQRTVDERRIKRNIDTGTLLRKEILESADSTLYPMLQIKLVEADKALNPIRLIGDAVVAAFFSSDNARQRLEARASLSSQVALMLDGSSLELITTVGGVLRGSSEIKPFHWEIEFPEVFDSSRGGFHAIVGNPPFAGKNTLLNSNPEGYLDWLKILHEESHGNSDLVAHFFRRAFNLLKENGSLGFIATNTIAQGDTRSTGLRWICNHGGTIYSAKKRFRWPGQAAVIVSVLNIQKAVIAGPFELDGQDVSKITAYLFHAGGNDDPRQLAANENKSFIGSYVLGMGFTFDDTDKKGVASSLAEMHQLLAKDRRNACRIFPYIGGEEILNSPTQQHHRYVINFGDMPENDAREWPDLMAIVETKVKPQRLLDKRDTRRIHWWQFAEKCTGLYREISGFERVLAISRVAQHFAVTFIPTNQVFAESLVIQIFDNYSAFAVLQSRIHETWARFLGSSMKDDLRYTPSDCFETFPFPNSFNEFYEPLSEIGKQYYELRRKISVERNEGLTKVYNLFHDPNENSVDISELRNIHYQLDKLVIKSYGWNDIDVQCAFILDYDEDEENENGSSQSRKKPWRYRWSNDVRDEILGRLLVLNQQNFDTEQLKGARAAKTAPSKSRQPQATKGREKPPPLQNKISEESKNQQLTFLESEPKGSST